MQENSRIVVLNSDLQNGGKADVLNWELYLLDGDIK